MKKTICFINQMTKIKTYLKISYVITVKTYIIGQYLWNRIHAITCQMILRQFA